MSPHPVKIAYVTDRGFLRPTLVSLWSLLTHLGAPAELHVWGDGLGSQDWDAVDRVVAGHPDLTLHTRALNAAHLRQTRSAATHISAATMGRLLLPRNVSGRVLYIDGDTLVTGDVAPVFNVDLQDAAAGIVRDFGVCHWLADPGAAPADRGTRLPQIQHLLGEQPQSDYFNAGVMLLDCDAIRRDPALLARIEDVAAASAHVQGDQDHLNQVLAGRVTQLDIGWNLSWGRLSRHRAYLRKLGLPMTGAAPGPARILHYHGPRKPWRDPRRDIWSSKGRATWRYRRQLCRFAALYPDLVPE
ncbi:glycosyltransferase family 8 protein [Paracoccus rhizosphaerae]|uniref:Glycosyltransferase family 8 protein n=1 Tax=Paracoccus rhizosphaerae TaxID=1133347 RepID=A0ABV6CGU2_9RHOB|nr:glycosyltransferase [Paracoccus rhizosphaerae]